MSFIFSVWCVNRWLLVGGRNRAQFGQGQARRVIVQTNFEVKGPCSVRDNGGGDVVTMMELL